MSLNRFTSQSICLSTDLPLNMAQSSEGQQSSEGEEDPQSSEQQRLPVRYSGNQMKCIGKDPNFEEVVYIQLFKSKANLRYLHLDQIVEYTCDIQNCAFYIRDEKILENRNLSPSARSKMKLMSGSVALKLLPAKYSPVVIEARPMRVAGLGDGEDSDNGVGYTDRAVENPYTSEEFYHFQVEMQALHHRFQSAKITHFQNAQGKFFFSQLTKVLTLDIQQMDSLHSTSASGECQPGALEITWILKYPTTRSSNRSEGQKTIEKKQQQTPDFVVWDSQKDIYRIVGEIKSNDDTPVFFQSEEQMMGLFKTDQKVMLGLVCQPSSITPVVARRRESSMIVTQLPKIQFMKRDGTELYRLAELILCFINFN